MFTWFQIQSEVLQLINLPFVGERDHKFSFLLLELIGSINDDQQDLAILRTNEDILVIWM